MAEETTIPSTMRLAMFSIQYLSFEIMNLFQTFSRRRRNIKEKNRELIDNLFSVVVCDIEFADVKPNAALDVWAGRF